MMRITLARVLIIQLLLNNFVWAGHGAHVGIVKSGDNDYFQQTIETLIDQADKALYFSVLNVASHDDHVGVLHESDLIITLGVSAAQTIAANYPEKQLISAYLTKQQAKSLNIHNKYHLSVLLDQTFERYLAFSQMVLNTQLIGIINRAPVKLNQKQTRLLKVLDFNVVEYQLEQPENLQALIRRLTGRSDALLILPDQSIYNQDTLKGVLLTTYQSRTPVISYSPAHTKSGALASIYSSPIDIGKHLGDILDSFLSHKTISERSQQYARYYSVAYNQNVAHALGLVLPDVRQLHSRLDKVLHETIGNKESNIIDHFDSSIFD